MTTKQNADAFLVEPGPAGTETRRPVMLRLTSDDAGNQYEVAETADGERLEVHRSGRREFLARDGGIVLGEEFKLIRSL